MRFITTNRRILMLKTTACSVVAVGCIWFAHSSTAGPLSSAEVTKIINRVSVIDPAKGGHPAVVHDVIKDDLGLQTGVRSRSELLFQDNTLTRIGAETFFSFKTGTRDLTLEKGSMLLQVPKGLGGAKIHTGAVTAAITGTTIMMEYIPRSYIKVLVLEGSLRLSRNGTFGDSVVLRPGKMILMQPDAKHIPDPIDVNLQLIVNTSTLVNFPGRAPLPSMQLIQAAIDEQKKQLAKGQLVPTNLVMSHGTNVVLASNDQLSRIRSISASGVNVNGVTIANVRGVTSGLPAGGSVTNTPISGTNAINNVLGSGGVVGQVTNTGTNAINNVLGSGGVVGQVTNTGTNAINNLANSINNLTNSGGQLTNNLLGGGPSGTVVSVSSTNQILGLLNNATSTSGGTVIVTPAVANIVQTVVQQTPAVSTVNRTNTLPVVNVPAPTVPSPVSILNTVSSLPPSPTGGVVPNQNANTGQPPVLGGLLGGH
jgi:FecR protein